MYYTSHETEYSSLSFDVSYFENTYGGRKWYLKRCFFKLLFLIVHIEGLKFWMHVSSIHVEGTVSQIFVSGPSFHFMSRNGQHYDYLFDYFFLKSIKKQQRTRTYIENMRHSSPNSNVFNTPEKFQT